MIERMKKVFLFILLVFLIFPTLVFGEEKKEKNVYLKSGETVGGDFFAQGTNMILSGTIDGDAYLLGGNIIIEGIIKGDLLAIGGKIDIHGKVLGNIRVISGTLTIDGEIEKNATVLSGLAALAKTGVVLGNLTFAGGNLEITGNVSGNLQTWNARTVLSGKVAKNSNVWTQRLLITEKGKIEGSLTYTSKVLAEIQEGASISGVTIRQAPGGRHFGKIAPAKLSNLLFSLIRGFGGIFRAASFVISLILGILTIKFFPRFTFLTSRKIASEPLQSFFIGFLSLLFSPLIFLAFVLTIIGAPLAFAFLLLLVLAVYFGKIFISLSLGMFLAGFFGKNSWRGKAFILGLLVYFILTSLPFLGIFLALIFGLTGLGALITTQIDLYQNLSKKRMV